MSKAALPNWLLSEDEVVNWLKIQPRTYKWQVLIALDRFKTNQLLLQDYIARYSRDEYFEPINKTVKMVDGTTQVWEYLYDHVLGPPRLSFENSGTSEWARLNMPILGGIQMTVEQTGVDPKQVTKISWYDPLQAPRLIAEIRLEDTQGEVDNGNNVELDLKEGTNFRVTFATTHQEQRKGGEMYEAIFRSWPPERQRFRLGQLSDFEEGDVLHPDKFRLRAISAQPARAGDEEGSKEGAILLFVGTKGHPAGDMPDKDARWVYPIPAGRSSTMLVANDVVMRSLLAQGISRSSLIQPKFEYVMEKEAITGIRFTRGTYTPERHGVELDSQGRYVNISSNLWVFHDQELGMFTVDVDGENVKMAWKFAENTELSHSILMSRGGVDIPGHAYFYVQYGVESTYAFGLTGDGGSVDLSLAGSDVVDVRVTPLSITDSMKGDLPKLVELAGQFMQETLIELQREIASGIQELETFRLYGLLFSGNQSVEQKSVRLPCDLAVFGDISPARTSFQITPDEKNIIQGDSMDFVLSPAQSDVNWTLESVAGFPGGLGSITQRGHYTAPAYGDIPGAQAYTMVRVTATKGEQTSSALVRVVKRSVVINPMVVAASRASKKIRLSGGSLAGGKLTWEVDSATGGTLTDTPPNEDAAEFDEGDMFYVPGSGSSGGLFSVDTITASDGRGGRATSHLILLEQTVNGTVVLIPDDSLPDGKIRLGLDGGKGIIPEDETIWEVLAGGGSVDDNGIYTVDADSAYPYTVIAGTYDSPYVLITGYLILPIPLVDLEEMQRVLA